MFVVMNEARFGVGLQGVAIGERAYQQALAYARERVQGCDASGAVVPIIRHPDVRRMLLIMRAKVLAPRVLAYVTAGWFDIASHARIAPPPTVRGASSGRPGGDSAC